MNLIKKKLIGLFLFLNCVCFAQQESIITLYRYNMNVINSAYAGVDERTIVASSFRSQWTGIKDAPRTQVVSFGTYVGRNLGVGVSLINDRTFIENQTSINADFSYKVALNEEIDLYFGLKAGGNTYSVNTSGLQTYSVQYDPALESISHFNPNIGMGVLLKKDKFFLSLSVPKMLNTERVKNNDGYATSITDRAHFYLSSGYDVPLGSEGELIFKPSFLLRYVKGAPISLDLNSMFQLQNNFEVGFTYRIDKAFAGIIDFTISKLFMVGFVYEISTNSQLANARNTNEVFLRFRFN